MLGYNVTPLVSLIGSLTGFRSHFYSCVLQLPSYVLPALILNCFIALGNRPPSLKFSLPSRQQVNETVAGERVPNSQAHHEDLIRLKKKSQSVVFGFLFCFVLFCFFWLHHIFAKNIARYLNYDSHWLSKKLNLSWTHELSYFLIKLCVCVCVCAGWMLLSLHPSMEFIYTSYCLVIFSAHHNQHKVCSTNVGRHGLRSDVSFKVTFLAAKSKPTPDR